MPDGTPFTPVPVAPRRDGWTKQRQRDFLFALAETGCVEEAAREVGMSARSAYRLRRRLGAQAFADGWDRALTLGVRKLAAVAFDRAVNGTAEPVWHKGEVVGERRRYNDRLLMFLLGHADPLRYGRLAGLNPHDIADPLLDARSEMIRHMHDLRDESATEAIFPEDDARPAH